MATENDKVNTGALATLVAVGASAMIGICLAVNALVRHEIGSIGAVRDEAGEDAYRAMKKAQLEKLDAPAALVDGGKGEVSIPIQRAMNLVLLDLKRSPWNATPSPPAPDAGADAAAETPDAASQGDGGAVPEPPASAALSPVAPPGSSSPAPPASAPRTEPSAVPAPPKAPAAPSARPLPPSPPASTR
jgi:hypothetical protein